MVSTCLAADSLIVRDNLFSPDRQPQKAKSAQTQSRRKAGEVTLHGTVYNGVTWEALLKAKKNEPGKWVKTGETAFGYTVQDISADKVSLSSNAGEFSLHMANQEQPETKAASPAATALPKTLNAEKDSLLPPPRTSLAQ